MANHLANLLALRSRLLGLSVCTTGAVQLSATPTGYARAAGSFVTDGFAVGMEIVASGFSNSANNGLAVITDLTATMMTVVKTPATIGEAAGAHILAAGLPSTRVWENMAVTPLAGIPFVEEDYLPGPATLLTVGVSGVIEGTPQYVIRLYGVSNVGAGALYRVADAILALFAPKTAIVVGSDVLRVRGDVAPYRGQILSDPTGWTVLPITIPLRLETVNSI